MQGNYPGRNRRVEGDRRFRRHQQGRQVSAGLSIQERLYKVHTAPCLHLSNIPSHGIMHTCVLEAKQCPASMSERASECVRHVFPFPGRYGSWTCRHP